MGWLKKALIGFTTSVLASLTVLWLTGDLELAEKGEVLKWFHSIPLWARILAGGIPVVWIVIQTTLWVDRSTNQRQTVPVAIASPGWKRNEEKVSELEHAGAIWDVMLDTGSLSRRTDPADPAPDKIRVPPKPKCKSCRTELIEEDGLWNAYVWKCPKCGKDTPSSDTKFTVAEHAEKVATSEWPPDGLLR